MSCPLHDTTGGFVQYYAQQQAVMVRGPAQHHQEYYQAPAQTIVAVISKPTLGQPCCCETFIRGSLLTVPLALLQVQQQPVQSATIMVPVQSTMQMVQPQVVHQIQPMHQQQQMMTYVPVQYGPELRGVSSPTCAVHVSCV
jgi:hypothetical protein